jgi:hypothetical protein
VADGLRLLRSGHREQALGAMRRHLDLDLLGRSLPYVRIATALARLLARVSEYTLDEAAESLADLRETAGGVAHRIGRRAPGDVVRPRRRWS